MIIYTTATDMPTTASRPTIISSGDSGESVDRPDPRVFAKLRAERPLSVPQGARTTARDGSPRYRESGRSRPAASCGGRATPRLSTPHPRRVGDMPDGIAEGWFR